MCNYKYAIHIIIFFLLPLSSFSYPNFFVFKLTVVPFSLDNQVFTLININTNYIITNLIVLKLKSMCQLKLDF